MNFADRVATKPRLLPSWLTRLRLEILFGVLPALVAPGTSLAAASTSGSTTLSNGLRIVAVYFPGSTNVSIFTFLPLGLASDGPGQTQWSHLVEHLVVRSTFSGSLSSANAETLPESMRLDFYGNVGNWEEGLSHHRRWLEGVPFTQASLEREKPRVKSECAFAVRNLATHKFAMAAWAQGFRHGLTNAAVLGDIDRVSLTEIQSYRDERLAVLSNVVVCIVGGIQPSRALSVTSARLGAVRGRARPAAPVQLHPGNREMTWDLDARHLLITWPIPGAGALDFAPLLAASQWLNVRLFSDTEIKRLTGMAFAGTDLATPEGSFFYLSASLRPGVSFTEVQKRLEQEVQLLGNREADLSLLPMLNRQLAESLTTIPDLASFKDQLPPQVSPAMAEGNIGLQWGMTEFRYGSSKPALARRLSELKAEDVQGAAKSYLQSQQASVTIIHELSKKAGGVP